MISAFRRASMTRGRLPLLVCSALVPCTLSAAEVHAQQPDPIDTTATATPGAPSAPTAPGASEAATATAAPALAPAAPPAAADASGGIQEIVVTAQRREQRLQDVPIAITALTQSTLQANRVTNVTDLSGLAPGVTVRPAAGGTAIPSFSMRGIVSYGVVPGSDKEVSIYVDGVYLGSPRGSLFELPDIARIEVLRGPQGTLFGRNATAGAISIVTREPTGRFAARQEFSVGNYNQFRTRTSIDLPAVGPFSGYVTFVHNERRGDIRNSGAGTVWDRTGPNTGVGVLTSPKYLGDKNTESYFGALRFEPIQDFVTTYKFDHANDHFTPEGQASIGINPAAPLTGALLAALVNSQPTPVQFDPSFKRPKVVNNSFTTPGVQRNTGHSLTSTLRASDSISIKNIAAYRKAYLYSASQFDGLGGLVLTPQALGAYATFAAFSRDPTLATAPAATQAAAVRATAAALAPLVGGRFIGAVGATVNRSEQWSEEIQVNYKSSLVDITAGALYFHQKDRTGGPIGQTSTLNFAVIPNSGRIPLGNEATSYNKATSIAAYGQAEVHVTSQIDLIGGVRVSRDKKSGRFVSGGTYVPGPSGGFTDGTIINNTVAPFRFRDTQPSYSAGVNYKPTRDILVYGKNSFSYVSGGSVGGVAFANETARSWEAGAKMDLFDRKVRANLAVYTTKYKGLQSAQGGRNVGRPDLGTVIISQGNSRAKGAELELTVAPVRGVTLNGSAGYVDVKLGPVNPILLATYGGSYQQFLTPKWSGNLSGQYETKPLFAEARGFVRVDAIWRSRQRTYSGDLRAQTVPLFGITEFAPRAWVVNGRVALRNVDVGPVKAEVALWGRNLNNNRAPAFPLSFANFAASSSFQPARTYGADLIVSF